jgi:hypothetical protein
VRTADVCRAARLPSNTPAVSSTKPSIAAAPIPNADHANARVEIGGTGFLKNPHFQLVAYALQ